MTEGVEVNGEGWKGERRFGRRRSKIEDPLVGRPTPSSPVTIRRQSSFVEEVRRQSAVFFDDDVTDGEEEDATTDDDELEDPEDEAGPIRESNGRISG